MPGFQKDPWAGTEGVGLGAPPPPVLEGGVGVAGGRVLAGGLVAGGFVAGGFVAGGVDAGGFVDGPAGPPPPPPPPPVGGVVGRHGGRDGLGGGVTVGYEVLGRPGYCPHVQGEFGLPVEPEPGLSDCGPEGRDQDQLGLLLEPFSEPWLCWGRLPG